MTLLGPSAIFCFDLFIFLFQRELSFCVFEGSFILQNCCLITTVLCFCEISQWQVRSNESRSRVAIRNAEASSGLHQTAVDPKDKAS